LDVQVLAARQSAALESMNAKIAAFLNMVTVANQSVPRMAAALASDVEQFSDRLEALSDTLNNGIRRLRQ
jgi:hypothetical protein